MNRIGYFLHPSIHSHPLIAQIFHDVNQGEQKAHQRTWNFLYMRYVFFIRNSFPICNKTKFTNMPDWLSLYFAFRWDRSEFRIDFFAGLVFHKRLMSKYKTNSKLSSKVYSKVFIWLSNKFHPQSISTEKRDYTPSMSFEFMKNDLQSITRKNLNFIHAKAAGLSTRVP